MSLITDLPAIFDQFSEARQKGFLTVMDLKERGIPLVGTYCTFMPQEIPIKVATASAKPINAPTSTFRIWWSVKPPATAKRKCMNTWRSLSLFM